MKEYTLLGIISILITVVLDRISKVNILKNKLFYLFLAIIALFKFLVNGYLTKESVFIYNLNFFLGLRLGSIPLEDFFFGFSLVTTTIIFWEYFKRRHD